MSRQLFLPFPGVVLNAVFHDDDFDSHDPEGTAKAVPQNPTYIVLLFA